MHVTGLFSPGGVKTVGGATVCFGPVTLEILYSFVSAGYPFHCMAELSTPLSDRFLSREFRHVFLADNLTDKCVSGSSLANVSPILSRASYVWPHGKTYKYIDQVLFRKLQWLSSH